MSFTVRRVDFAARPASASTRNVVKEGRACHLRRNEPGRCGHRPDQWTRRARLRTVASPSSRSRSPWQSWQRRSWRASRCRSDRDRSPFPRRRRNSTTCSTARGRLRARRKARRSFSLPTPTATARKSASSLPVLTATLAPTSFPIVHTRAAIEEQQSLGKTPFAFVVHVTGALGGRPGYRLGDSTASGEVGCPPSGSFHFVIHAAGASADRFIPCRVPLAATGPVALASWPPAPIAPAPTPCTSGPCAPAALPTPPSSTPTCPPNYVPAAGGCTPASPPSGGSGPRYHVTATLASPTMTVGGPDDSFTARADLTNASAVAPGTPSSLPVQVQNSRRDMRSDTIWFAAVRINVHLTGPFIGDVHGDCRRRHLTRARLNRRQRNVSSDDHGIAQRNADASVACDLMSNGKCYHRIVDADRQHISQSSSFLTTACDDDGDGATVSLHRFDPRR